MLVRERPGVHDTGTRARALATVSGCTSKTWLMDSSARTLSALELSSVPSNGKRANKIVLCLLVADVMDFSDIHGNMNDDTRTILVLTVLRTLHAEYLALLDGFRVLEKIAGDFYQSRSSTRFQLQSVAPTSVKFVSPFRHSSWKLDLFYDLRRILEASAPQRRGETFTSASTNLRDSRVTVKVSGMFVNSHSK